MGAASAGGDYNNGSYGQLPEGHEENSDSADSEPEIHNEQIPHPDEQLINHHHHSHNEDVIGGGGFGGLVVGGVEDRYEYVGNQVSA